MGWNREAHAASAGGFLLFWTSLWSAVPGGVAGAVSDPCLPQDPHPHAGAVGLWSVLRWPRWAGGVVLGTAGSSHGCTKSGCTCSSHGVGSVAVTQIAILTLRERHRQGGGRWSGWDAGALVPSFGNFPRGPCPPCSCSTAAVKPAVSWTPEHGQGCDLLPSHSSCSLGLRALRTNCQQFSLPVSPGLPQLPPRGVAAAPCCPQDTATPAAWRSWASVNHPWLIPR